MIKLTEDMFKVGKPLRQGEVYLWMKKYAPKELIGKLGTDELKVEDGKLILGHSETGHHHVLEPVEEMPIDEAARAFIDGLNDTFVALTVYSDCVLKHLRGNDTHGSFMLPPGEYIRVIREEQSVEGWRRVAD